MRITENASLLPYNTFHLDVKARVIAEYTSVDELRDILHRYAGEPFLSVGEGSNLLFTHDYDGVVLHSCMCRARALKESETEVWIEAESGLRMDALIEQLADMDLRGVENLSYIPGTVGASAVQNVGAYGVEAKDVIEEVNVMDVKTGANKVINNTECQFAYRNSRFKQDWKDKYVITSVVYRLQKEGGLHLDYGGLAHVFEGRDTAKLTPVEVRGEVIRIRQQKLPEVSEYGSAGSFYKNPIISREQFAILQQQYPDIPHYDAAEGVKVPAGWLIEQAGMKGRQIGDARVWDKQALVIANMGKATAEDIVALAAEVVKAVEEKFAVTLSPEVNYI